MRIFRIACVLSFLMIPHVLMAQSVVPGALPSYHDLSQKKERTQQYWPESGAFVCENGVNRFTRALYGSHSDWRVETSDRPIFAIVKKNHHRSIRFVVDGISLDSTDYCKASYGEGMRSYLLKDKRWRGALLKIRVVASPSDETAVWHFSSDHRLPDIQVRMCQIANPRLRRNGDMGADKPEVLEPDPKEKGLVVSGATYLDDSRKEAYVVVNLDAVEIIEPQKAAALFNDAVHHWRKLSERVVFDTPDPYLNTLGSALVLAADGDWDGQTWLHGCIGWRMPLAGWRAAYAGDVLGWNDRQYSHFNAYAKSQVTEVEPVVPHPSQDAKMNMARAEKRWGTQMYSNGYICRNPERNNQMHHYDMNLNYIDELLWHFQYDADSAYLRKMWPVLQRHLAWEKRNYDPYGDHLYDAYCCIWASDALYYSGGAVTHSSAYNYRGNLLAARIAEIIGEDAEPYRQEAIAIKQAMDERLWLPEKGVWAEYEDALGLKRKHESPALWSIYTPIDCGACSDEQAWKATGWVEKNIPHIPVSSKIPSLQTISTSNWLPYSWSINNVATAEVWHTVLAFFRAGRFEEGYRLMMANIMDNMYYGQSPANFGQLSYHDAARGECYRDFGDCIGIASRALIQGFFGVVPQALDGKCLLTPAFPDDWNHARLKTPYIEYQFTRKDGKDCYEITQHFTRPLKMILAQRQEDGSYRYVEGSNETHQILEVETIRRTNKNNIHTSSSAQEKEGCVSKEYVSRLGLAEPDMSKPFLQQDISSFLNSEVDDIFKNQYLSPRPRTTTLQIPVQGVGEWCHPTYTPVVNDSVFRTLAVGNRIVIAGVPFSTPQKGANIAYTSLWDNYPDSLTVSLKGKASSVYLLMAGSTNHMQSRIDNGIIVVSYKDGTRDTLYLRNPDNWCPIEQDYYVDGMAFQTIEPRPYRVCLSTGTVSRDLGKALNIKGVYGREIPGGAAQLLRMPLHPKKKLRSLTLRPLSNDVVIGLMAITLQ